MQTWVANEPSSKIKFLWNLNHKWKIFMIMTPKSHKSLPEEVRTDWQQSNIRRNMWPAELEVLGAEWAHMARIWNLKYTMCKYVRTMLNWFILFKVKYLPPRYCFEEIWSCNCVFICEHGICSKVQGMDWACQMCSLHRNGNILMQPWQNFITMKTFPFKYCIKLWIQSRIYLCIVSSVAYRYRKSISIIELFVSIISIYIGFLATNF